MDEITKADVARWHSTLLRADPQGKVNDRRVKVNKNRDNLRSKVYVFLSTVFRTAVELDIILSSPCVIRGAGQAHSGKEHILLTDEQIEDVACAVPGRYSVMVLLAGWLGLRYGELAELRRKDVDMRSGVIHVRRGVVYAAKEGHVIGAPKSRAGSRSLPMPDHVVSAMRRHLLERVDAGLEALLFPGASGETLRYRAWHGIWTRTLTRLEWPRGAGARPTFHDLRHAAGTRFGATGASLPDIMAFMGHSSLKAAQVYMHSNSVRIHAAMQQISESHTRRRLAA